MPGHALPGQRGAGETSGAGKDLRPPAEGAGLHGGSQHRPVHRQGHQRHHAYQHDLPAHAAADHGSRGKLQNRN